MSDVITGLFDTADKAREAVAHLEVLGVTQDDISIIANDSYTQDDFAVDEGSKAATGGIIGAASTGIIAAIAAGLTTVGTVATGGTGLVIAGPIVAALAAGGAGAAIGGTIGGIIGAFVPKHEIKFYEDAIEKGSILLGVKYNDDNKDKIQHILKAAGTTNVSTA